MCTGRVDLSLILHAFAKGADGVFIGGCWPGECHYVTEGNYDALGNTLICKKLFARLGVDPERICINWIAASEGARFAELVNDFVAKQRARGPLGQGEQADPKVLRDRLLAAQELVPWLKLVERERLRVPVRTEQAYHELFASEAAERIFDELVGDRLVAMQIVKLLEQRPQTTAEIAKGLGLETSVVAKHLGAASRQGWARFDPLQKRYTAARKAS